MAVQRRTNGVELRVLLFDEVVPDGMGQIEIYGIELDSRKIHAGDLFIAVPGVGRQEENDGRNFIEQAIAAGAAAVLCEQKVWQQEKFADSLVPILSIPNLKAKASALAGRFYGEPSQRVRVIGITGTNGKTTIAYLLAQLLNLLGSKTGLIGTLGYGLPAVGSTAAFALTPTGLTTPDPVECQRLLADLYGRGAKYVVMEVSSHGLDQHRVSGVAVRGAVFTNLSRDHLDYHGTMANYLATKRKLFTAPGLEFAVINVDDQAGSELMEQLASTVVGYSYSVADVASLRASSAHFSWLGLRADIDTPWGRAKLKSSLLGEFNLGNLLAVIGVACVNGFALADVVGAIEKLRPVPGRLEVINSAPGPLVIVDYAHTPDALAKTLAVLRSLSNQTGGGKLWCVFGCGGQRDRGKRPEMGAVAAKLADVTVVTSDNPRNEDPQNIIDDILAGASPPYKVIEDRAAAIKFAINSAKAEDIVLIAGKGHEQTQLILGKSEPFSDTEHARLALHHKPENSEDSGGGDA
jgi:UDP-N-acetylmuramoyl-L-alanyl-D-glutamate--2,6-diaminopimelate ligase